jgi:hypothetical protein
MLLHDSEAKFEIQIVYAARITFTQIQKQSELLVF